MSSSLQFPEERHYKTWFAYSGREEDIYPRFRKLPKSLCNSVYTDPMSLVKPIHFFSHTAKSRSFSMNCHEQKKKLVIHFTD